MQNVICLRGAYGSSAHTINSRAGGYHILFLRCTEAKLKAQSLWVVRLLWGGGAEKKVR